MRAAELLAYLEASGFRLWADGDTLDGEGPTELLTPNLLAEIREAKADLLAILQGDPPAATPKPPGPESWRLSNGLSIIGMEPWDLQGEDADLARLARRDDDGWRPRISKF